MLASKLQKLIQLASFLDASSKFSTRSEKEKSKLVRLEKEEKQLNGIPNFKPQ